jgi:diguanylate cyclase (GGDEF)-like protein
MGAVVVFRDVSESRKMAQQLSWQASYDPLTGLPNRREFERYLRRAIATAKRENREHTLAFLDLDRFKIVNDTSGHIAGDELLRQVSMLLQDNLRQTDLIARFGGDEFAILLYGCQQEDALPIVQNLVDIIKGFRFVWQDKLFTLGASVGITTVTANNSDITQMLSRADAACYVAKEQGRNRVYVYRSEDNYLCQPHGEMEWAGKIQEALKFGGFHLYYQAIVPLRTSKTAGAARQKTGLRQDSITTRRPEAVTTSRESKIRESKITKPDYRQEHYEILLRLVDKNNNLITPGVFIPAAERYQLMPTIDRWVVKTLFGMKEIWDTYRDHQHHALFTINLSGASLNEESFWEFLTSQIALHQIPPHLLCFEITETVAIANITTTSRFIRQMRELGCSFSLDDFGSGMSSFGYLKNLPVDYLKIDGEFIKDIVDSSTNAEIAAAIHRIGHVMGMQTIAEYVTNQEVWQKVLAIGIDYAQGYYIHQPQPLTAEAFSESRQVS